MLKRSITYTDFDDEEVTEEFYFNLSKTEIIAMETKKKGGFSAWIQEMVKIEDTPVLMKEFETFILMTYGEKSPDGKLHMMFSFGSFLQMKKKWLTLSRGLCLRKHKKKLVKK
jgi:hypothetical protein